LSYLLKVSDGGHPRDPLGDAPFDLLEGYYAAWAQVAGADAQHCCRVGDIHQDIAPNNGIEIVVRQQQPPFGYNQGYGDPYAPGLGQERREERELCREIRQEERELRHLEERE
jgi:hypothetical protein